VRKTSIALVTAFTITLFSVNSYAAGNGLLKQKMDAKGITAGSSKILAQYQIKFKQLLGQIQYEYNVLDAVVKKSQNLSDDDKAALIDLLENDPDYSYNNVQKTYASMMASLVKNDNKALVQTLENQYKLYSDVLANLNDYQTSLPQYYMYGDNTSSGDGTDNSGTNNANTGTNNGTLGDHIKYTYENNTLRISATAQITKDQAMTLLLMIKPTDAIYYNDYQITYDKFQAVANGINTDSKPAVNPNPNTQN